MINQPQIPEYDRRPGQRGDTTETYVRQAQDRASSGASPVPVADREASGTSGGGGLMGWLGRLWPFKRGG